MVEIGRLLTAMVTPFDDAGEIDYGQARKLAKGLVNYGAEDVQKILGKKTGQIAEILGSKEFDEVIHRDNLVLL